MHRTDYPAHDGPDRHIPVAKENKGLEEPLVAMVRVDCLEPN
jgi:hypothetical protein